MKNLVIIMFLSILTARCNALSGQNEVTLKHLEAQLNDIHTFVNEAGCSNAGQCSYLPIGSKACGGPMGFIVFSNNIDIATLKKMVDKYTEDQKLYNIQNNVISDCSLPNPPERLDCVDGKCAEIR